MSDIRWRKKDTEELKRKVRNYNAKINRLIKKNYNGELVPAKLKFKDVKNKIENRMEYKEQIQLINALTKRGSEESVKTKRGAVIPKFELEQTKIKVKKINKDRKKRKEAYEKTPPTDRNKSLGETAEHYRDMNVNKIRPKKFNWENMSKKDFEMYKKSLYEYDEKQQEKEQQYRDNFYKAMEASLNDEQFEQLKKIIDLIPSNKLVEKFYTDINMKIDFFYEPTEQQLKFEEIIESWKSVQEEGGY